MRHNKTTFVALPRLFTIGCFAFLSVNISSQAQEFAITDDLRTEVTETVESNVGAIRIDREAANLAFRSVELQNRVRLRETTNQLRQSQQMMALQNAIDTAPTMEAKRLARIAYHEALGRRLKQALPSLSSRIEEMTAAAIGRNSFSRVRSNEELAAEGF